MNEIYITGHKNPDLDSVASSIAYAYLKNTIDKDNSYVPICCGSLNQQSKYILSVTGFNKPRLVKNILPKVADIARKNIITLDVNDPIYKVIKELNEYNLSVIPVFENATEFKGTVSIHEITDFLINKNLETRPLYCFHIDNFSQVLPGYFYQTGLREFTAPIMIGAMSYKLSIQRASNLKEGKPLFIIGMREKIVQYAIDQQFPAIILTGIKKEMLLNIDLSAYQGTIFISKADTAETVRLLRLSAPVSDIMSTDQPVIPASDNFEDAKKYFVNSKYRGLPVFDGDCFAGIITRRCFIDKPRQKLILVDHNELNQSIEGAHQAKIMEIIDHHRLGTVNTNEPIYIFAKPVGSTCTVIYQIYKLHGIKIPNAMAKLMLSAILSDTVMLKSPTTTKEDRTAIIDLSSIAKCDWLEWGNTMFFETVNLCSMSPLKIVKTDFKVYHEGKFKVGIGQVETLTLENFNDMKEQFLKALQQVCTQKKLDWTMLLITNVIKSESLLLMTNMVELADKLIYKKLEKNLYFLPGVLSRKKQLIPELCRVIEESP